MEAAKSNGWGYGLWKTIRWTTIYSRGLNMVNNVVVKGKKWGNNSPPAGRPVRGSGEPFSRLESNQMIAR